MSNTDSTATEKRDVYRKVTDAIVNAIEQGVGNWRMPWHTSGRFAFSPMRARRPIEAQYSVSVGCSTSEGYERGEWGTLPAWQEREAQVRKGEKATLGCSHDQCR